MPAVPYGPNTIEINGDALLLTASSGGAAVHLTRAADEPGTGQSAVPEFAFTSNLPRRSAALAGYDRAALSDPRWSPTTLCGRQWASMVGGDGGDVSGYDEVAFAPTCRRCLTLIDRHFPKPAPDSRLAFVAQLAADVVIDQRGYAEIHGVPGDQQDELRKTVRTLIQKRTNHSVRTYAVEGVIYVECQAIHEQHVEQGTREAVEAINAVLAGDPTPRVDRDWVISWAAWDIG